MTSLVECVPNFSEGRDLARVSAIVSAMSEVPGTLLLDRHSDHDHNRSVISIAGEPDTVAEAVLCGIGKAAELIDLTKHAGAHPRIGATDVVPFVPIHGITLHQCAELAKRIGHEIWRRYGIPVYFYEAAALRPDRVHLENIRRGQFEKLRVEAVRDPARAPDVGGPGLHPTAGATIVGARKFLIAYNIDLDSSELDVAERIARKIRFSSGGLPFVKAMAVKLRSRGLVQVSMNLTDFEQTPVHRVYETVKDEAQRLGVEVTRSEIVGLIPRRAIEMTAEFFLQLDRFSPIQVLENRIEESLSQLPSTHLHSSLPPTANLAPLVQPLLSSIVNRGLVPAGGSAIALTAAVASSLGEKIAGILLDGTPRPADPLTLQRVEAEFRELELSIAADADREASACESVVAARKMPVGSEQNREQRALSLEHALHAAIEASLDVAQGATKCLERLGQLEMLCGPSILADVQVGRLLSAAAARGASLNISANLKSLNDEDFAARIRTQCERITSRLDANATNMLNLMEVPK